MIAIVNVSKKLRATGWHDYEVRVNREVICKFRHKREDGLAVCLEIASKTAKTAPRFNEKEKVAASYVLGEKNNA